MILTESIMTVSDYAAWWGAIIATLVFIWEIYKWHDDRPKLRVTIGSDLVIWNELTGIGDKKYLRISVVNRGGTTTKIEALHFFHYKSYFKFLFSKPSQNAWLIHVVHPNEPMPFKIDINERWTVNLEQTDELYEFSKNGFFCVAIYCSHCDKPIRKKIKFN